MLQLPIDAVVDAVVQTARDHRCVVVHAPPGAGKSTRVPAALLDAAFGGEVWLLEPRRVAARAIASRIAHERGTSVGAEVGWQIRGERKGGRNTRLWVATEGILTRRAVADPFLDGIGTLILDEFHERSIHTDVALSFARELVDVRDDFRLVVMSATLDAERISEFLQCPVVACTGRVHPVEISYRKEPVDDLAGAVRRAATQALETSDGGDILVFLPGLREIDDARDRCGDLPLAAHRLHSALPPSEREAALRVGDSQRIILATSIAETSLTIPSVTTVIDSGLRRTALADPATGFDRLETKTASLASAEQRAGRAGRVRPGRCFRLWTQASEFRRSAFDEPEIHRIDLSAVALQIIKWSGASPTLFPWFDAPAAGRLGAALEVLRALGAVHGDSRITALGERLCALPVHPRLGRFSLEAARHLGARRAALAAGILAEPDWVTAVTEPEELGFASDIDVRVRFIEDAAAGRTRVLRSHGIQADLGRARRALEAARRIERMLDDDATDETPADEAWGRALTAAFPERIGFRASDRRYALSGGGSVVIDRSSVVRHAQTIVASTVFGTTTVDGVICGIARSVAQVDRQWLDSDRFCERVEVVFDSGLNRLVARRVVSFDALELERAPTSLKAVPQDVCAAALADAVAELGTRAFDDRESKNLHERIAFLRRWMPELELPDPFDAQLLAPALWGLTSLNEVQKKGLWGLYQGLLTHNQRSALEQHAPARVTAAGKTFRIDYQDPVAPVLAARIQQLFGVFDGPTLAAGRVRLTFHLLAPNGRPQQVTQDLASFWSKTYAEVRRELRARYPKHAWPEDPNER